MDPVLVDEFARLDRDGELEGIKEMLDLRQAEREDQFHPEIAPYLALIIAFCADLGIVTKAVTGTADTVKLARTLASWIMSARKGAATFVPSWNFPF